MKFKGVIFPFLAIVILSVSCGSNADKPASGNPYTTGATAGTATGEAIYRRTCIACHQANGQGVPNTFPPLAGADFLKDKEMTISQVLNGKSGEITVNGMKYNNTMPPQPLSDQEVADVLTYVYGNFGNTGMSVTSDEVRAARAKSR